MNRDEALQEVVKRDWWPVAGISPVLKAPHEWDWVIQFGEYVLVHTVYDPITVKHWQAGRNPQCKRSEQPANKYQRTIKGATLDVYDVLTAWDVRNPAVQHAVKKLLQPGTRGHKDKLTDLREALASIERAIELEDGRE